MKKFLLLIVSQIFLGLHNFVNAQSFLNFPSPARESFYPTIARPETASGGAGGTIAGIIAYGIGIAAILAVIAITWAGISMFLSVGDQAKFEKAKEIMIYALVGAGLSAGAYLIVTVISRLSF